MRRRRRARGARSGPRWRGVDGGGFVRPGARRCAAGGQKLLDPVQCHLVRQRLRGAHGELGVVGVHRDLLELVAGDGTAGLRRLRCTPPRPATAIRAGLPQRVQELLRRRGQPGQQGLALPGRGRGALRSGPGRGSGGGPCGDRGGPTAAPLAEVLRQVEQRPLGAGLRLSITVLRQLDSDFHSRRGRPEARLRDLSATVQLRGPRHVMRRLHLASNNNPAHD